MHIKLINYKKNAVIELISQIKTNQHVQGTIYKSKNMNQIRDWIDKDPLDHLQLNVGNKYTESLSSKKNNFTK